MSKETREYAKQLVSQMTLEEKMSQMVYQSPAIERLGIPAYNWWNEALHGVARAGVATVFPQAIGLAATFDKELLQEIGDVVSTEGRAKFNEFSRKGDRGIYKGLTFWAPNVNIFRDPRWGRGHETYGEDPYLTGRAHIKHTEGGDFRQATYRAVRQGLKKAESVLLEPVYAFRLEIPSESTGRALNDIQRMYGSFEPPEMEDDMTVITGTAPVVTMQDYQKEVTAYSRGRGRVFCTLKGYEPCHNAEEVIASIGYDSEADVENPTGSVFCAHGAGFVVPWNEVEDHMHLEYTLENPEEESDSAESAADRSGGASSVQKAKKASDRVPMAASLQEAEELEEIFTRTYGKVERKRAGFERRTRPVTSSSGIGDPKYAKSNRPKEPQEEYLLVDGYNIIFAWDDLNELARYNIESARGKLMDILSNYQGYKKMTLILVFDAYKVKGNQGEVGMYHNIHVVYTKEAETADQYIEKTVHRIGHNGNVTVASSDGLEQIIIMGAGAHRLSARDLRTEIEHTNGQIRENYLEKEQKTKSYLLENASGELGDFLKELEEERKKESKKSKGKA